jgi:drug/metabolite transporter (DMT)-like permease
VAAIALLVTAVTLFTLLDTAAKVLATWYQVPVQEIVWLRFVGQTVYMIVIFGSAGMLGGLLKTRRLGLQMGRSGLMVTTTACNFIALQTLRLDQTVTITFLAPLVVAALAGPLLGEWVGWRRALAIVIGFIGVVVAMHPGVNVGVAQPAAGTAVSWAIAASLLGMMAYAAFMLVTRYLSAYDPPHVTLFYSMLAGTLLGLPFALNAWVWPQGWHVWALLAALGALGGAGHMLFIYAYKLAPASSVSPFLYVQLLTMVAAGFTVFGDVPDRYTMAGAAIVIASGVYLVHREHVTARDAKLQPPTG